MTRPDGDLAGRKLMQGKVFLDTNVIIYLFSIKDEAKKARAFDVINENNCVTSIQAINESTNVWLKKFGMNSKTIASLLESIELICDDILSVQRETIESAILLHERYGFSYFDCLMLASALEGDCDIIFTEDMNNGQVINETLKIVNPFA